MFASSDPRFKILCRNAQMRKKTTDKNLYKYIGQNQDEKINTWISICISPETKIVLINVH